MVDFRNFYRATNPNKSLNIKNEKDAQYYIDFASVRGDEVIQKIKKKIILADEDESSCTLFTGPIGCGKTTELRRLQQELEVLDYYVIYFESDRYLEISDVDIVDILLVIANRIVEDLEANGIQFQPTGVKKLMQDVWKIFNADVTGLGVEFPFGKLGVSADNEEFSVSLAIAEITAKAKDDSRLREQMNQYLGPKKSDLLKGINQELLQPATETLLDQGKAGLVVIVDNLDRIDNTKKPFGKTQQEYLFVDQAEPLKSLACHLVYTMPLGLIFSDVAGMISQRFGNALVLPMVSVQMRSGEENEAGMEKLRQMVLARAFPALSEAEREQKIGDIFASAEVFNHLCRMSGGHVRDLLRLLNEWLMEEMEFPLTSATLEKVIIASRNSMQRSISRAEQELLEQVKTDQTVNDEEGYNKLIRSRYVFEYQDEQGSWYAVNPILG